MIFGAVLTVAPLTEAVAATPSLSAEPQIRVRIGPQRNRRWNRRARTVTTTRITRVGRARYRETIRTTYFANGTTRTVVIRRQRLNRWRNY